MRTETILLLFIFGFSGFAFNSDAAPIPPITSYKRGYKERVEYIVAVIHRNNLDTGTPPNAKTRAYSKSMSPYEYDDAGQMIAARLGGTGSETYNIVPQNWTSYRKRAWRTRVEGPIYDAVSKGNIVTYEVWPRYKTSADTRPVSLKYRAKLQNGKLLVSGIMSNPVPKKMSAEQTDDFEDPTQIALNDEQDIGVSKLSTVIADSLE